VYFNCSPRTKHGRITHWSGNLPSFRESLLKNWKISKDKMHLAVADNASNLKEAMKESQFEAQVALHTLCN